MKRFLRLERLKRREAEASGQALAAAKMAHARASAAADEAETALAQAVQEAAQPVENCRLSHWVGVQAARELAERQAALRRAEADRHRVQVEAARQRVLAAWREAERFAVLVAGQRRQVERARLLQSWWEIAEQNLERR